MNNDCQGARGFGVSKSIIAVLPLNSAHRIGVIPEGSGALGLSIIGDNISIIVGHP